MPSLIRPIRIVLCGLATSGAICCQGQAQQYVLDTVDAQAGTISAVGRSVTATTDGGTILHLTTNHGDVQWKLDQGGEPAWCKKYEAASTERARMPDGGVVFCDYLSNIWSGDSAYTSFRIVRSDAQGEVIWSKVLAIQHDLNITTVFLQPRLASDEAGNCLFTTGTSDASYYQFFFCLDTEGVMLWSNTLQFNPATGWTEHICSDGMGGWFFGSYTLTDQVFRLGHFNVFGEMVWYNSYQWGVLPGDDLVLGGITCIDNCIVATGRVVPANPENEYHSFMLRLELDGSLDWIRSYYTDPGLATNLTGFSYCGATSSGELLASGGYAGILFNMVHLSGEGEVIGSFRRDTIIGFDANYSNVFWDWDVHDTTLNYVSFLWRLADSNGSASYRPALWRLPVTDLTACSTQDQDLYSTLLPSNAVIVNDQPYAELPTHYTISDSTCLATSFEPISVSDYCFYFSGGTVEWHTQHSASVSTTLVAHGTPITVSTTATFCLVTLHDVHGRLLASKRSAPYSTEQFPTWTYSPGMYLVRIQQEVGGNPSVTKVLVE